MHLREHFTQGRTAFSFEFFPPKTPEASDALFGTISDLEPLRPSFVSVTYGAGGSTRELTRDLVVRLKDETTLDPMPHLTCVCHTRDEIHRILERYAERGISNILALRGDVPKDRAGHDCTRDAFRYAAQLVAEIRDFGEKHHPDGGFGIAVAGFPEGHPETPNRLRDIELLKAKVDAGADCIITQLFFDNRDFYDFRDRCRLAGIRVPIVAGIMPVTSVQGMRRMAELALGARFPAPLLRALNRAGDDPELVRAVGVQWAAEQARCLLDSGVDGIHFYTLNKSTATREVYRSLGIRDSLAAA